MCCTTGNTFPDTGVRKATCQIQFHISSQHVKDKDLIIINPTDIRDMASWVLGKCFSEERLGGVVTEYLANALDWLLVPSSDYFTEDMH